MLMCILVPTILLSIKYCVDIVSLNRDILYGGGGVRYKQCAAQVALAVAQKYNPGLTLNQQKESLLRVADAVYNNAAAYIYGNAIVHRAIPGLEVRKYIATFVSMFNPLVVNQSIINSTDDDCVSGSMTVEYTSIQYSQHRLAFRDGANQAFHRIMYGADKDPKFLLREVSTGSWTTNWISEEMFWDIFPTMDNERHRAMCLTCNEYADAGIYVNRVAETAQSCEGTQLNHSVRRIDNEQKVQVVVDGDKIAVTADSDQAYAIPAECNIDIVLAIPINGAACNMNNTDKNSPTAGVPTCADRPEIAGIMNFENQLDSDKTHITNMRTTPIYQIAQACKKFLRDNFEFTRGVNVGLIPYSGKLSIPPDRKASWTTSIPPFVSTEFLSFQSKSDQSLYQPYIRGCFLYGTIGMIDESLVNSYLTNVTYAECNPKTNQTSEPHWGLCFDKITNPSPLTGIMCRGEFVKEGVYGDNTFCQGDLLSTAPPASDAATKFRRMNVNPCYLKYANFLTMQCENRLNIRHSWQGNSNGSNFASYYQSLPYFLIELQPDIGKICDLLSVFSPFADDYNVSNFLFIPITWANNLFQSWSNDPGCDQIDTVGESLDTATADAKPNEESTTNAIPTGGRLSRPSKMTLERRKALILIVNKPDWFEPGELTYLGFNNDFSEIPMIKSDIIDFSINFGNNPIKSSQQILEFQKISGNFDYNANSGYYETLTSGETITAQLFFPNKYLVKIVVKPASSSGPNTIKFINLIADGEHANNGIEYEITEQKAFFIEASQINNDNIIIFNIQNLRLVSAEITNRPYRKIIPMGSLSGTINALGMIDQECVITSNIRAPLTVQVSCGGFIQTIAFSNVNSSSLSVTGTQQLSARQTFTFPTASFANNYTAKKVGYTTTNTAITSATLRNQVLRIIYNTYRNIGTGVRKFDSSVNMIGDSNIVYNSPHWRLNKNTQASYKFNITNGVLEFLYLRDSSSPNLELLYEDVAETVSLVTIPASSFYTTTLNGTFTNVANGLNGPYSWYDVLYQYSFFVDSYFNFIISGGTNGQLYPVTMWYIYCRNNNTVSLGSSSDVNSVWLEDGNICFNGTGDLSITVQPLVSGTITHTLPETSDTTTTTFAEDTIIMISPETHQYIKQEDGTYTIALSLDNAQLLSVQMVDTSTIFEFLPDREQDVPSSDVVPVNTVLYCGARESSLHRYAWQSSLRNIETSGGDLLTESDGKNARTPTTACQKVTSDAVEKLMTDWDNNIRVYVIKFRKQTQYKDNETDIDFNYSYIDSCASDPDYVYDVDTTSYRHGNSSPDSTTPTAEENLARALSSIANNIKTWINPTSAQNVLSQ
jgi:hypothetical protein